MIRSIPLNRLVPSPRNVRRTCDPAADLQLKADIEARGLLQNLVVTKTRKPRGAFAVEAGERRRRALAALVEEGKLDAAHDVCCLVIAGGPAATQEAGLAENFQRLAMNPADECLAFGQLIEEGADIEGIARRFGLTNRFVEGRLRLSALAPAVFDALGAGAISLDIAKAYAATPDRERQAWVFEQLQGSYAASHPDSIRRMMTQATASASDRRVRLVGEEAYVAAGGRIERDLFSEEAGERWLDMPLLERLAAERMEALAAEMAAEQGLAWVRPTLETWVSGSLAADLHRIVPERAPLSEEETARIAEAQAEIDGWIGVIEDEESEEAARELADAAIDRLEQEIRTIADKPPLLDAEQKAQLGAFLLLDPEGRPVLDSVFYSEAAPEEAPREGDRGDPECPARSATGETGDAAEEHVPSLSRALVDELAIQRRDILAVHVAADPAFALDLAIFLMVDREAGYWPEKSGSSLLAMAPTDPVLGFKTPEAPATIERARAADVLDRGWTNGTTRAERFDLFCALPKASRAAWLAHAVARTLEASVNLPGTQLCRFHDHLGRLLGIDVASWWRPTGANYFDRVPKALTLAALEEVGGPAFAARHAKAKKAELAESAQRIFAGEFIGEVEVKERALAWVPEPMRFAVLAGAAPVDDLPPWEDLPVSDGSEQGGERAADAPSHPVVPVSPPAEADIGSELEAKDGPDGDLAVADTVPPCETIGAAA